MDQCSSPTSLANIRDQIAANLIALFIWEVGKSLFFRYIWKTNQNDKKNHCNVFTQKLQDIQDDQKALSTQQEKQLKNFSILLNKVRQEQMSGRKQIDNHHHHTSPDLSHPQRPSTQASTSSGRQLNIAPNRQVWDLGESITAEVPPAATHARLSWMCSPRTSPVLQQGQSVQHDSSFSEKRRGKRPANLIQEENVAGPSSRANFTAQSAEEDSVVPADLGITFSDEEPVDDPEEDPEDSSSEADESAQSSNQIPPMPSISPTVPGSSATQSSGSNWATGMGQGRGMSRSQKR